MSRKTLLSLSIAAASFVSVAVFAQHAEIGRDDVVEAVASDAPYGAEQLKRIQAEETAVAAPAAKIALQTSAAPTPGDVYDVDSFKRRVVYLGLTNASIRLDSTCPTPAARDEQCAVLNPAPSHTRFDFQDVARIRLPENSTHSLLCYWFSPLIRTNYNNGGTSMVYGRLRYSPTVTIENPVLDDPRLIDPTTGAPFGGKLLTGMTSSESFVVPLAPGVNFTQRTRNSTVCRAGLISKRALMRSYGLSEAQATAFFTKPTMVRLNVSGSVQNVGFATFAFSLRLVGDER